MPEVMCIICEQRSAIVGNYCHESCRLVDADGRAEVDLRARLKALQKTARNAALQGNLGGLHQDAISELQGIANADDGADR